jgi:hypothetical protein
MAPTWFVEAHHPTQINGKGELDSNSGSNLVHRSSHPM